jgi:O-antigen biosynthesis protein
MKISVITPTHDTTWIADTWTSLKTQTHENFEWIVLANDKTGNRTRVQGRMEEMKFITGGDKRLRVIPDYGEFAGVGARKKLAFSEGQGEVLVELDHDDLLTPDALTEVAKAFEDPEVGFMYSDFADFQNDAKDQGAVTYREETVRPGWVANGFKFYQADIKGVRPGSYECVKAFPPSAVSNSLIFWCANHVRAWRRSIYEAVGGHNPAYKVCDDHELIVRTYLMTKMVHVPKPLYLYRVTGENTWAKNQKEIAKLSSELQGQYLDRLVRRECELLGLPAYDLGSAISPTPGWKTVDTQDAVDDGAAVDVVADLTKRWPWEDGSVGAFRASDLIEHLPDKMHTISEIWRCLRPGGWLLSLTPSADGRGADMDPTHRSRWNQNSFWYYTRESSARYIRNKTIRFQEMNLETFVPSQWHAQNGIPYVKANLIALKPTYEDGPGEKLI